MIYPTGRSVALAFAGAPVALAVAVLRPDAWGVGVAWTLFAAALTVIDAVMAPGSERASADVVAPGSLNVGERAVVRITARLAGTARRLQGALGIDARLERTDGARPIELSGGAAEIELAAVRRGRATIDALWLRWQGPLGLAWRQRRLALDRELTITPDIRPAQQGALMARDSLEGLVARRVRGEGGEFDALAEFRPGMDRRQIDWKSSARHMSLLAREFRAERNNNVVFAVDAGRTMCEPVDGVARLDRAVAAALLGAFAALRAGDRVALFGFDARPRVASGMVAGPGAFAAFQRLAARLDYSTEETNFTLALSTLAGRLDRRSLVVLFTEVVDPVSAELMLRMVGPLAERHLLLFVLIEEAELERMVAGQPQASDDVVRATTAAALLRERRIVIERLKRMGVRIIEAPHEKIGPKLVEAYLDLKQGELL